eukprot:m.27976 g.27976  ORF g.27976 m.27976 type:complete len:171 (+) comp11973_c0_seq2:584-1096(+)
MRMLMLMPMPMSKPLLLLSIDPDSSCPLPRHTHTHTHSTMSSPPPSQSLEYQEVYSIDPWVGPTGRVLVFMTYGGGPSGGFLLAPNGDVSSWHQTWGTVKDVKRVEGQLWYNPSNDEETYNSSVLLHDGEPEAGVMMFVFSELMESHPEWGAKFEALEVDAVSQPVEKQE